MDYTIRKSAAGNPRVSYPCARCAAPLEWPLSEAGTEQTCPDCGLTFVTPGAKEWAEYQQLVAETKRRHAEARERAARDASQRQKKEEAEALAHLMAPPAMPPPRAKVSGAATGANAEPLNCENCGRRIGALETPYSWNEHVVCHDCHTVLSRAAGAPLDYAHPVPPALPAPSHRSGLSSPKTKAGDSVPFVVLSLILIGLGVMAELGGAPVASWFFWGIWFILLIVRIAISSASR